MKILPSVLQWGRVRSCRNGCSGSASGRQVPWVQEGPLHPGWSNEHLAVERTSRRRDTAVEPPPTLNPLTRVSQDPENPYGLLTVSNGTPYLPPQDRDQPPLPT